MSVIEKLFLCFEMKRTARAWAGSGGTEHVQNVSCAYPGLEAIYLISFVFVLYFGEGNFVLVLDSFNSLRLWSPLLQFDNLQARWIVARNARSQQMHLVLIKKCFGPKKCSDLYHVNALTRGGSLKQNKHGCASFSWNTLYVFFKSQASGCDVSLCGWQDDCAFLTTRSDKSLIYQLTQWNFPAATMAVAKNLTWRQVPNWFKNCTECPSLIWTISTGCVSDWHVVQFEFYTFSICLLLDYQF